MKKYLYLALAAASLMLAGPALAAPPDFNPADLLTFTQTDIQAADTDAAQSVTDATGTHMKDPIAHQCYAGVLSYMASQGGSGLALPPAPVGAISAFQDARDIVKGVQAVQGQGLLPPPIIQACGALYLDARQDILRAAAAGGGLGLTVFGLHL